MKKKIVGIFVCMLMIAAALPAVGTTDNYEKPTESQLSIFIEIIEPKEGWVYIGGTPRWNLPFLSRAFILGQITFKVDINSTELIECVDWYVDGIQEEQYTSPPYDWSWGFFSGFPLVHKVVVEVIDHIGGRSTDSVMVFKIF
ncbi:MAG: hypothetical protein JSW06_02145 [Thermoplasmatales archaeon]|nr:MAG: hypothetical protein JSW06_02145 [Thermoplasmatales archaeon]